MKKKQFFNTFAAGIFAAAILAGGLVSSTVLVSANEESTTEAPENSDTAQDNNASQLQTLLENEGFYVQQGSFYELDTLKEASAGRLLSCFGNNAGSSYMVFNLPAAPEQDNAKGNPDYNWPDETATLYDDPNVENAPANPYFAPGGWQYKLGQDEAIVLITQLPPECKYYSFINYVMFTQQKEGKDYTNEKAFFSAGNEETGLYHPIFGSIGDSVNMVNIKHDGDSAYGSQAVIVISANQTVTEKVTAQLTAAGYDESMINVMPIPADTYNMGLQKGADTFSFLGRISQPTDQDAYDSYTESLSANSVVYRVSPQKELDADPYENAVLTARGTGEHEISKLKNGSQHLDEIREAIISQYANEYDYEELSTDIAVPEGLTAYLNDRNAQGDNRDTAYVMTKDFTLNSDEDFVVVYGVNHTQTGKALYSNAVLYARPMLNGVCSVYDSLFPGSATSYLEEDCDNADDYYVYKMARTQMDDYTAIIEHSTGNEKGKFYGVDNGDTLLLAFRAYMDENNVGASYYEIVYDRAIVFHKK